MAWHFNADENTRLKSPPPCFVATLTIRISTPLHRFPPWTGNFATPEDGCKFDEAWDTLSWSMCSAKKASRSEKLVKPFRTKTAIWHFLNHQFPIQHTHTVQNYSVEFSGGARTNVRIADRYLNVHQSDRLLVDGGDGCIPALWRRDEGRKAPCEHIAWSQNGGHHEWC